MSPADKHEDDIWGPDPPRFQSSREPERALSSEPPIVSNVDVVYVAGERVVTSDEDEGADNDVAEIREEIEQTRAELSDTIDQIQERLSPQTLVEEAREAVKTATIGKAERMVSNVTDSARGAGWSFMDTIKENPIPAAMAGLGLGWLLKNRSSRSDRYYSGSYEDFERRRVYGGGYGYAQGRAGDYPPRYRGPSAYYGTRTTDEQGNVVERVQEKAGEVVEQARETAGEVAERAGHMVSGAGHTTREAGSGLMDVVRRNPVPAAIAAVSLGWLFVNRESDHGSYYAGNYQDYEEDLYDLQRNQGRAGYTPGYGEQRGGVGSSVSSAAGRATDAASGAVERVTDVASSAAERVGSTVGSAAERVADVGDTAGYQVRRARTQLDRWLEESPLAVGAVALGLGAAAGLAAPSTRQEGRLMGGMRETFVEKVQEVAQDTQEKVQQVVQEVQHTATEEAKSQNLTA